MADDVHDQYGQSIAAAQKEQANIAFPEWFVGRLLQAIERRGDLVGGLHQLSHEQRAATRVFDSVAGGMAVRKVLREEIHEHDPVRRVGDELLYQVPHDAKSAIVFSTGRVVTLGEQQIRNDRGNLPIPGEFRELRLARVEFYDAERQLIAITSEPPADKRQ